MFIKKESGFIPRLNSSDGFTPHLRVSVGFTLLELLIVIGILAVLSAAAVLILNPAEMLRQSRDARRINDLGVINSAINLALVNQGGAIDWDGPNFNNNTCFGQSTSTVFVSVPKDNGEIPPALPTGWHWGQVVATSSYRIDGYGWLPIDFGVTGGGVGANLPVLPVDPTNTFASEKYYTYVCDPELTAAFESTKFNSYMISDGGDDKYSYETGSNLKITPRRFTLASLNCVDATSTVLADDGLVRKGYNTDWPPSGSAAVVYNAVTVQAPAHLFDLLSSRYRLTVGLMRFNTGMVLPDDATVISAKLKLYLAAVPVGNRNLVAEYYSDSPTIFATDWTSTPGTTAFAGQALSSLVYNTYNGLTLQNVANISKTDYTRFRLHLAETAAPASDNSVTWYSYEAGSSQWPILQVCYIP